MKITNSAILKSVKDQGMSKMLPGKTRITVSAGTCGIGNGADLVYEGLQSALMKKGIDAYLCHVGCFGFCASEPLVAVAGPGQPLVFLKKITPKDIEGIVKDIAAQRPPAKNILGKVQEWDHITGRITYGAGMPRIPLWNDVPFFKGQKKIVLRNCGFINPEDIEEYIAVGGYSALAKALNTLSPEQIIEEVKKSKLRGRGGAGFPTGKKWELIKTKNSDRKYIICNADEGDPGAFMNRNEIESDPHSLIEGMSIGAYAIGAREGIIYIRAEYPLAVRRIKKAIEDARTYGLLGENIFGSGFSFDLSVVEGAGAFVCGEETSLIESIEGKAGRPRFRPPYPAERGLWGKPTNINNVETWFNIPVIIAKGGDWFNKVGTETSAGTKVFSLVGKLENTGLVELPLGSALESLVYQAGQAHRQGKKVKAVLSGGPSGGCIPAAHFNTPVDYESLAALGAIMGSGGMVVMNEDNCMVDIARFFLEFTTFESCGKCVPCREGLYQALKIIRSITDGKPPVSTLDELEELAKTIKDTAFCGLGQTGPNPVLTTLRYFKDEYQEHIKEKRCRAGVCQNLFLSPCENSCPLHMNIPGFLQLVKENRIEEAFISILQDNPLPATTGRICHHPCESRCRRNDIDGAVTQRDVHRYIADTIYAQKKDALILKKLAAEKLSATGKKIAIAGSGPAGLAAAFYLARLGHQVTVYEAHAYLGGMLRGTIPEYRLPKSVLDKEICFIKDLGVKFVLNKRIGADESLRALEKKYDAIFLAIGAQKEISLGINGEDLKGVFSGIEFLEKIAAGKKPWIGKKTVVFGGGNVAIDSARSALRLGSDVTIVYRREKNDLPAAMEEIEASEQEGITFEFLTAPKNIIGDKGGRVLEIEAERMVPGEFDSSGRRKPLPTGQTYRIPCDTVILAVGERVDSGFIKDSGVSVTRNGLVEVDTFTCQTNNPKIYAGGDLVTGPATVSQAMAAGKKAAEAIDIRLTGKKRFQRLFRKYAYRNIVPLKPEGGRKQSSEHLTLKLRKNNFKEVSTGFSENKAETEASRCLRCDVKEAE
jgi:NADH-quinone oxidoreductase subunit F